MKIPKLVQKIKSVTYYFKGRYFRNDPRFIEAMKTKRLEASKSPSRTTIINYLLSLSKEDTNYLEIGVRNPEHNFNHIKASFKYSVDPGVEYRKNPAVFKMTSDDFFKKLSANEILSDKIRFDVIFIDGLHLAPQVDRDIKNAVEYIKGDGFIVLHDCNPPTEWHARESFDFIYTPAKRSWNGTTWKAFLKWRFNPSLNSCCIDSDWGIGILSKNIRIGNPTESANPFFEYSELDNNRKALLNLIDFETLKKRILTHLPVASDSE